jgi:peptidoglycan/LPS O-acetylase OafA/YrhL
MMQSRRRHAWPFYALNWVGGAAVVLLVAALLTYGDHRPMDWTEAVPLAVVISSIGLFGLVHKRQGPRR